jgi:heme oxygenase (biliverdin-IX-beta and delta-forming)
MQNTIHAQLKSATHENHTRVEQVPISKQMLSDTLTLGEYSAYLSALYGFIAPSEKHITGLITPARQKLPLLEHDLAVFGIDPGSVPLWNGNLPLDTLPRAFGYLYVIEGSTLGGRLLLRHVTQTLKLTTGTAYLKGYGENTGAMWKEFCAIMTEQIGQDDVDSLIRSACATFEALEHWLGKGAYDRKTGDPAL